MANTVMHDEWNWSFPIRTLRCQRRRTVEHKPLSTSAFDYHAS
jgi:hypothetical protein